MASCSCWHAENSPEAAATSGATMHEAGTAGISAAAAEAAAAKGIAVEATAGWA